MEYKCYSCAKRNNVTKAGMGTNNLGPKTKHFFTQLGNTFLNLIPVVGPPIANAIGNNTRANMGSSDNPYVDRGPQGNFWNKSAPVVDATREGAEDIGQGLLNKVLPGSGDAVRGLGDSFDKVSKPAPPGTIQGSRYAKAGGRWLKKGVGLFTDLGMSAIKSTPLVGDNFANFIAPNYEYRTKAGKAYEGFQESIREPLEGLFAGALDVAVPGAKIGSTIKGADDKWDKNQTEKIEAKREMFKRPLSETNSYRFAKTGGKQDINKVVPVEGGVLEKVSSTGTQVHGRKHQEGGVLLNDEIEVEGEEGVHDIKGETVISSATLENPETGENFAAEMLELEKKKGYLEQRLAAEEKSGMNKNTIIVLKKKIKELDDEIAALYGKQEMVAKEKGLRDAQGNPNAKSQEVVPSPENPNPAQSISRYGGNMRINKKKYQIGGIGAMSGSSLPSLLEEETKSKTNTDQMYPESNTNMDQVYPENPETPPSNPALSAFFEAMKQSGNEEPYKSKYEKIPEEENKPYKDAPYYTNKNNYSVTPYYNTKQNTDRTDYSKLADLNRLDKNQGYYNEGLNYYSKFGGKTFKDKKNNVEKIPLRYASTIPITASPITAATEPEGKLLTPTRLINEAKANAKNTGLPFKTALKSNKEENSFEEFQPINESNLSAVNPVPVEKQPVIYYAPNAGKNDKESEKNKQVTDYIDNITSNRYLKETRENMIKYYLDKLETIKRLNKGYAKARFGGSFKRLKGGFGVPNYMNNNLFDSEIYNGNNTNSYNSGPYFKNNDNEKIHLSGNFSHQPQQPTAPPETGGERNKFEDLSPWEKAKRIEKDLDQKKIEEAKNKNSNSFWRNIDGDRLPGATGKIFSKEILPRVEQYTEEKFKDIAEEKEAARLKKQLEDERQKYPPANNQPVQTQQNPKPVQPKQPTYEVREDVRAFQTWYNLKNTGNKLDPDGKFGPKTKAAYAQYEKEWEEEFLGKHLNDNDYEPNRRRTEEANQQAIATNRYGGNISRYKSGGKAKSSKNWIDGVTNSIKKRGTEGRCTGSNFGGPGCPPGSRQYNLAVTFKNMARSKHKYGGKFLDQYGYLKSNKNKNSAKYILGNGAYTPLTTNNMDREIYAFSKDGKRFDLKPNTGEINIPGNGVLEIPKYRTKPIKAASGYRLPTDDKPPKTWDEEPDEFSGPADDIVQEREPLYTPEQLEAFRKKEKRRNITEGVLAFLPSAVQGFNAIKSLKEYAPRSPVDYKQQVPSLYAMRNFYKQLPYNTKAMNSSSDLYTLLEANKNAGNDQGNIAGVQAAIAKQRSENQAKANELSSGVMTNAANMEYQIATKQESDNNTIANQNLKNKQDLLRNSEEAAKNAVNAYANLMKGRDDRKKDAIECAALANYPIYNQNNQIKRMICNACPELCDSAK